MNYNRMNSLFIKSFLSIEIFTHTIQRRTFFGNSTNGYLMLIDNLNNLKYSPDQIGTRTKLIYNSIIERSDNIDSGNFRIMSVKDVALIFGLYDKYYFEGFFNDRLNGNLNFRISKRMTRAAGKLSVDKNKKYFTLSLSTLDRKSVV